METISLPLQVFAVSRNEARLIRKAARVTGGYEVTEALAHYLGVRTRMASSGIQKPLIAEREKLQSPVLNEMSKLPQLVEWSREQGVENLRYLYGPLMARAAMGCVQVAVDEGFYEAGALIDAQLLLENYHSVDKQ